MKQQKQKPKDNNKKRVLLFSLSKAKGDFVVETFRCGGNGGQNVNKLETGVRIRHPESGAVAESREERTQGANKKIAFNRLVNCKTFKLWHKMATARAMMGRREWEEKIKRQVEEMMKPENLRVEAYDPDHPEITTRIDEVKDAADK